MIFINTEGHIVYANKACEQQLGYKKEEFYAEDFDFLKLVAPESIVLIRKKFRLHMQGKEITPYEYKIITRDNRELSIIQATRLIEFQGKESILGIITDITERKHANDALRESENKFRQAFENAALGICIFGLDGKFNKVNLSLCQLLGYSEKELLSMSFADVTHPDDIQISMNKRRQMLSGETENAWYEKRYVHKQGQTVWVMLSTTLLYDERGEPLYFVTQTQDITKRKQTEEALRNSEQELSSILNTMQDAYYRADNKGYFVRVSPAVHKLLGYTSEEIMYTKLDDYYVHPEGREKFLAALGEASGRLQNYETQLRHKDGSVVWVSTNAQYLKDEQGIIIGIEGTTRDVSLIKFAEDLSNRFGRILDNSSNEIYIFDVEDMHFTLVNKGALQNLGYTMQEMERLTPADLKPDYTKESFKELIEPLLKGEQEEIIFQTRHMRKNGTVYPVEVRLQLSRHETPPVFVTIIQDITKRIQTEERLQFLAHHDALTSLPNRVLFSDRLNQSIARARRHKQAVAVLFLDLDRFKLINDTLGHDFGDRALQSLAERLSSCIRDGDTVARLGGDEFAVVLEDVASADDVAPTARKILDALTQSFMLDEREFFITTSIGISLFPVDGEDTQTLLKHADIAMYRSKDLGRNTYQFYSSEMSVKTFERLSLETSLRHALEREEFLLHYQPQFDMHTGKVVCVEALLRWQHPDLGLIMPVDFIPLLEDTGLIVPVGEWVLRTACAEVQSLNKTDSKSIRIAVNLSSRQFSEPGFTEKIRIILKETGLKSSLLELEITETVLMQNVAATVKTLDVLNEMGIRFAIDDFGTGYSSLGYLKRFPIDTLKIDQTFIHDMIEDQDDAILVEAITTLGRTLHLNIVAEGAETEAHINFLKQCHCDCIQGY
ncbi:MAG: PAS domain S-box protein, partial [Acidiferrobacterales bacterium]